MKLWVVLKLAVLPCGVAQWHCRLLKKHGMGALQAMAYGNDSDMVLFTGEMVFPWMFEDLAGLHSMKGVAELLAQRTTWSKVYDLQQLQRNEVPVVAATYVEDMYVVRAASVWIASADLRRSQISTCCFTLFLQSDARVCIRLLSILLCEILSSTHVQDFTLAQVTAEKIKGIRQWMTNEYQHSVFPSDQCSYTVCQCARVTRVSGCRRHQR